MSILPDAPWRHRPGLARLWQVLGGDAGETRVVGGAVRDTLLGLTVSDIDLATVHTPDKVIARLDAAAIKAVPTGIAHGTVTAVIDSLPYEVTTLRSDVSTDGRRATVAFSADWQADAARRDFTMNALYADIGSSEVFDYFGGAADLTARHVRFIGAAEDRIREDHLRILRFFRFFARYGEGEPDREAYAACQAQANSLMALSRERIADELFKLLAAPDPSRVAQLMLDGGIFAPVLPEVDEGGVGRLATVVAREEAAREAASPIRRLAALLPPDPALADQIGARLKLSNRVRKRLTTALEPANSAQGARELAFRRGEEGARDTLLLDAARDVGSLADIRDWAIPTLPIGGTQLMELGLEPGPAIARALGVVRENWIAEGFPDAQRVRELAIQAVAALRRERQ